MPKRPPAPLYIKHTKGKTLVKPDKTIENVVEILRSQGYSIEVQKKGQAYCAIMSDEKHSVKKFIRGKSKAQYRLLFNTLLAFHNRKEIFTERIDTDSVRVENWDKLLLTYLKHNEIVLITGATGCGKSSLVPPLILNTYPESTVLLIQPRRIASTELASYIAEKNHYRPKDVGVMIGFTKRWNSGNRLVVATAGSTINMLLTGKIPPFDWIILDEVHEMSIDIEICFALLNRAKRMNTWPFKLILMSATVTDASFGNLNPAHFVMGSSGTPYTITERQSLFALNINTSNNTTRYYKGPRKRIFTEIEQKTENQLLINAVEEVKFIITIRLFRNILRQFLNFVKRNKGIENEKILANFKTSGKCNRTNISKFTLKDEDFYFQDYKIRNVEPLLQESDGDLLLFLPSMSLIRGVIQKVQSEELLREIEPLILHSDLSDETRRENLYSPIADDKRWKLFLSTNISETSLTIPGISHVIDSGLSRTSIEMKGTHALKTVLSTHNQMLQRRGRIGRTCDGTYVSLLQERTLAHLSQQAQKEIDYSNISSYLSKLLLVPYFGPPSIILENTFSSNSIRKFYPSLFELWRLGCITPFRNISLRYKEFLTPNEYLKLSQDKNILMNCGPSALNFLASSAGFSISSSLFVATSAFLGIPFTGMALALDNKEPFLHRSECSNSYVGPMMMSIFEQDAFPTPFKSKAATGTQYLKELETYGRGWVKHAFFCKKYVDETKFQGKDRMKLLRNLEFVLPEPSSSSKQNPLKEPSPSASITYPQFLTHFEREEFLCDVQAPPVNISFGNARVRAFWSLLFPFITKNISPMERIFLTKHSISAEKLRNQLLIMISWRLILSGRHLVSPPTALESLLRSSFSLGDAVEDTTAKLLQKLEITDEMKHKMIQQQLKEGSFLGILREEQELGAEELRFRVGLARALSSKFAYFYKPSIPRPPHSALSDDQNPKQVLFDESHELSEGSQDLANSSESDIDFLDDESSSTSTDSLSLSIDEEGGADVGLSDTEQPSSCKSTHDADTIEDSPYGEMFLSTVLKTHIFSLASRPFSNSMKFIGQGAFAHKLSYHQLFMTDVWKSQNVVNFSKKRQLLLTLHELLSSTQSNRTMKSAREMLETLDFGALAFLKKNAKTKGIKFNELCLAQSIRNSLALGYGGARPAFIDELVDQLDTAGSNTEYVARFYLQTLLEFSEYVEILLQSIQEFIKKMIGANIETPFLTELTSDGVGVVFAIRGAFAGAQMLKKTRLSSFGTTEAMYEHFNENLKTNPDAEDFIDQKVCSQILELYRFVQIKVGDDMRSRTVSKKAFIIEAVRRMNILFGAPNRKTINCQKQKGSEICKLMFDEASKTLSLPKEDPQKLSPVPQELSFSSRFFVMYRTVGRAFDSAGFGVGVYTLPFLYILMRNVLVGLELLEKRKIETAPGGKEEFAYVRFPQNYRRPGLAAHLLLVLYTDLNLKKDDTFETIDATKQIVISSDGDKDANLFLLGLLDRLTLFFRTYETILLDFSDVSHIEHLMGSSSEPTLSHDWRLESEQDVDDIALYTDTTFACFLMEDEPLSNALSRFAKELIYWSTKCPPALGAQILRAWKNRMTQPVNERASAPKGSFRAYRVMEAVLADASE
eukprot:gnl/Chilomastix_cuspidata/3780.p1 GENE.gnl/Chilomastix_cuspidata/3780~~gnl/Chilomastix_cuspidata/3780.p1  ORF type:complete len:1623 (-),score=252.81 gnl/Chilomastix_cuspidata/3780:234-5102(-)